MFLCSRHVYKVTISRWPSAWDICAMKTAQSHSLNHTWFYPPGTKAWRNDVVGSWFISVFCETLKHCYKEDHLLDILLRVNNEVGLKESSEAGAKQMPCQVSTLTKKFMLGEWWRSLITILFQAAWDVGIIKKLILCSYVSSFTVLLEIIVTNYGNHN